MLLQRMTGTIESLGESPSLRTETGQVWSLRAAPGVTGDWHALLHFRIGEKVELIGSVPGNLAGKCLLFSVQGRKLPDGPQIDLMSHLSATKLG